MPISLYFWPMLFRDIIGQEDIKERLRKSFHEGRIPHATMLYGSPGCGNLALAVAFARYISCESRTADDSCGKCAKCQKFSSFQFADLHFSFPFFNITGREITISDDWYVDWRAQLLEGLYFDLDAWRARLTADKKQLQMSVHEAQSILNKLSLKSYEGGFKFMIIWMPEFMKPDTANKLLKIVEEPPANTLFLFVSSAFDNMLPTMMSRIQLIRVPMLQDAEIQQALISRGIDEKQATDIAHFSGGNWYRALQLADNKDPNAFYAQEFQDWMRLCYSRQVIALSKWSDTMHDIPREEQKHFLRYALDQLRQNLLLNYVGEELAKQNASEKEFSMKFARFINHHNIEELSRELSTAYEDVSRNAYSKMVFFDLSLKMHRLLKSQEN